MVINLTSSYRLVDNGQIITHRFNLTGTFSYLLGNNLALSQLIQVNLIYLI